MSGRGQRSMELESQSRATCLNLARISRAERWKFGFMSGCATNRDFPDRKRCAGRSRATSRPRGNSFRGGRWRDNPRTIDGGFSEDRMNRSHPILFNQPHGESAGNSFEISNLRNEIENEQAYLFLHFSQ